MIDTASVVFRAESQVKTLLSCPQCGFTRALLSEIDATPLLHYFHSWFAPKPDETRDIKKRLSAVEAERSRLRHERQNLQAALHQVDRELKRLDNIAASLTGAASYLRHFPAEILQCIFELALPHYAESKQLSQPPWTISYVCSRWRQIAVSTPSLWIRISPPSCQRCSGEPRPSTTSILGLYAERSQELPLCFTLTRSNLWGSASIFGTDTCYACQLLLNLSPRIRHLNYWTCQGNHWETGLRPTFPQLYSVRGFLDHPTSIFANAPLLKSVDLQLRDPLCSLLGFPWAQLTYLKLEVKDLKMMKGASLLEALRQCVDLTFFGLKVECRELDPLGEVAQRQLEPVVLPRLRVLHAIDRPWFVGPLLLPQIIAKLRCPGLESLTIFGLDDVYHQFLKDSQCQGTLVELFIGHPPGVLLGVERACLLRLLNELYNIEALTIHLLSFSGVGPGVFDECVIDELCSPLYHHSRISDSDRLRVIRVDELDRPSSYIGNSGKLWRNSFSYLLHKSWYNCPELGADDHARYAKRRTSINQNLPQRLMKRISFPEFVDESVPAGIVGQSGFKYLCVVCTDR